MAPYRLKKKREREGKNLLWTRKKCRETYRESLKKQQIMALVVTRNGNSAYCNCSEFLRWLRHDQIWHNHFFSSLNVCLGITYFLFQLAAHRVGSKLNQILSYWRVLTAGCGRLGDQIIRVSGTSPNTPPPMCPMTQEIHTSDLGPCQQSFCHRHCTHLAVAAFVEFWLVWFLESRPAPWSCPPHPPHPSSVVLCILV